MEQVQPINPGNTGASSAPSPLGAGGTEDFNDEVDVVIQALHRLDISNGRLRVRLAKELGISATELSALAHVGTYEEMTPKDLAGELGITSGSVTAMIDRLEKAGYILRHPNPLDRRSLLLELTPDGEHAVGWVYDCFHKAVTSSLSYQGTPSPLALEDFLRHAAAEIAELSGPDATTQM